MYVHESKAYVCACVRLCEAMCVRACVRVCEYACVRVCEYACVCPCVHWGDAGDWRATLNRRIVVMLTSCTGQSCPH